MQTTAHSTAGQGQRGSPGCRRSGVPSRGWQPPTCTKRVTAPQAAAARQQRPPLQGPLRGAPSGTAAAAHESSCVAARTNSSPSAAQAASARLQAALPAAAAAATAAACPAAAAGSDMPTR